MTTQEYRRTLAERAALDNLLDQLPVSSVIERQGLEFRRKEVEEILASHRPPHREAARGARHHCEMPLQAAFAARRSQKSSKRPLRMQQRRAMMALAPATVQRMPARLSRAPICLHPASTTPDETHRPLARNCG